MLYVIFYDIPNSIFEELLQETPKDKNIEAKQTEVNAQFAKSLF